MGPKLVNDPAPGENGGSSSPPRGLPRACGLVPTLRSSRNEIVFDSAGYEKFLRHKALMSRAKLAKIGMTV